MCGQYTEDVCDTFKEPWSNSMLMYKPGAHETEPTSASRNQWGQVTEMNKPSVSGVGHRIWITWDSRSHPRPKELDLGSETQKSASTSFPGNSYA